MIHQKKYNFLKYIEPDRQCYLGEGMHKKGKVVGGCGCLVVVVVAAKRRQFYLITNLKNLRAKIGRTFMIPFLM